MPCWTTAACITIPHPAAQDHTLQHCTPQHCILQHCTVQHCTLQQHHTLQHCTPQPCTLLCTANFSAEPPTVLRITEVYFCGERFWSCLGIVVQSCDPRTHGVRGRKSESSKSACSAQKGLPEDLWASKLLSLRDLSIMCQIKYNLLWIFFNLVNVKMSSIKRNFKKISVSDQVKYVWVSLHITFLKHRACILIIEAKYWETTIPWYFFIQLFCLRIPSTKAVGK